MLNTSSDGKNLVCVCVCAVSKLVRKIQIIAVILDPSPLHRVSPNEKYTHISHICVYTQPLFSSIHNIAIIMWPPTCMHIDFMLNNLSPLCPFSPQHHQTKPHQNYPIFCLVDSSVPFFSFVHCCTSCVCTVHSLCFSSNKDIIIITAEKREREECTLINYSLQTPFTQCLYKMFIYREKIDRERVNPSVSTHPFICPCNKNDRSFWRCTHTHKANT